MIDACPRCGEEDLLDVGVVVLACRRCGWTLVGEHPCDVCGRPAAMSGGLSGEMLYRCSLHAPSLEDLLAVRWL